MNDARAPSPPPHQRKIRYVDEALQKWLLIGLVGLEVTVLSVAGAILYFRLNAIVDESLYRIHFSQQASMFSVLLGESLPIVGGLIAVNLLALFAADRLWSHHVRGIVQALRKLLSRVRDLDLREDGEAAPQHEVLAHAHAWRQAEGERHRALCESLAIVESAATLPATTSDEFRARLLELRRHLPAADRRARRD